MRFSWIARRDCGTPNIRNIRLALKSEPFAPDRAGVDARLPGADEDFCLGLRRLCKAQFDISQMVQHFHDNFPRVLP